MNPEDDPRYIPPVLEYTPAGLTEPEIEADISQHEEWLQMCSTQGWKRLMRIMESRRDHDENALILTTGATDLDVIFALRQGLVVIASLMAIEKNSRDAILRDQQALSKIREAKQ